MSTIIVWGKVVERIRSGCNDILKVKFASRKSESPDMDDGESIVELDCALITTTPGYMIGDWVEMVIRSDIIISTKNLSRDVQNWEEGF